MYKMLRCLNQDIIRIHHPVNSGKLVKVPNYNLRRQLIGNNKIERQIIATLMGMERERVIGIERGIGGSIGIVGGDLGDHRKMEA